MHFKRLELLPLLFWVIGLANTQPLRKTDWVVLNNNATTDGYSYPRVASFKSGNYAIIFGYVAMNDTSGTQIQFYNITTGNIYNSLAAETSNFPSTTQTVGPFRAQNIIVFPDDTAYAIWQSTGAIKVIGLQLKEFGDPLLNVFTQYQAGKWYPSDYVDIAGSSWSHYVFGSVNNETAYFGYKIPYSVNVSNVVMDYSYYQASSIHSAVSRTLYSAYPVIYTIFTYPINVAGTYNFQIQAMTTNNTLKNIGMANNATNAIPFVLDDLNLVVGLFVTSDGRIQLIAFDITNIRLSVLYQGDVAHNVDSHFVPSVIQMGNNVVLIAFSTTSNRINYQMVKISRTQAVLVGPEVTHDAPSTSMSVSMASTVGSDIVVVAKDVTGTQILSRTITFCGNGALDLKEECDGSSGCTSQCKCQIGTVAVNGTCVDQCQNGIVTGSEDCDSGTGCVDCKCASGYKPMSPRAQGCDLIPKEFVPNVKPQFDCLEVQSSGVLQLHFSYINNDGFDETISYGALNSFAPSTLGADRPMVFMAGQSLTYPASPYSTNVTSDTLMVTWILTSYNLTVDLTNSSSLVCPRSLSVTLTMSTFANLTDALVQKLLENIAGKYNISESRLNATYTLQSTNEQGLNTYVIVITISPPEMSLELPPIDVVKDLLNDLQTSKENLVSELTQGLEEINPVIKSITPSIVETRGTSAVPISVFSPNSDPNGEVSLGGTTIFSIYLLILTLTFVLLI